MTLGSPSGEALAAYLEQMAAPQPSPAAGAALAVAAGMAAALAEKACALTRDGSLASQAAQVRQLRAAAADVGARDEDAYALIGAARRTGGDERAAWRAAAQPPLELAALAAELAHVCDEIRGRCNPALRGDVASGRELAAAACRAALVLAEIDLAGAGGPSDGETARIAALRDEVAGP
jgi:formiminotetrahydrofolate cyclodeaminase